MKIAQLLDDYLAPDSADSSCQEVVRLLQFKRTTDTMGEFLVYFHQLRRKVTSRMQMGGAFPGTYASALRMQHASLSRSDKSPVLAIVQRNPGISAVARQMRRLLGQCGL